jgi:hypothetical protein
MATCVSHPHPGRKLRLTASRLSVLACLAATAVPHTQPAADLEAVLTRAGAYVTAFQAQLGGIVLEEEYLQDSLPGPGQRGSRATAKRRRLRSDLLMVRLGAEDRWIQFRDVFEVDGRMVRDRDERLARLFLQPSPSSLDQADAIARESARYNLGRIERTINLPLLALSYFQPAHQARSAFARIDAGDVKAWSDIASAASIWAISYRETAPDTMIRTAGERDLPASGRIWVDATTGRILRTELVAKDARVKAQVEVTYRFDAALGFLVPAEMREEYSDAPAMNRILGRARYGKIKRFMVTTDEVLRKPPGPGR